MKRALQIGCLLVLMLGISLLVLYIMLPIMNEPKDIRVSMDEQSLARGDYLFNSVLGCPICHSERNWSMAGAPPMEPIGGGRDCDYTGVDRVGLSMGKDFPGTICFSNITPDRETGIGTWTDGEIMRAIREGIDNERNALFPTMPYAIFSHVSDQDLEALVAYMRTLKPVKRPLPDSSIDFPISMIISFVPRPVVGEVLHPDETDTIAYGEYLTEVARCKFCHSPRSPRNRLAYVGKNYTGGVEFSGLEGMFYSTNLTPHDDGLGTVSLEEFVEMFRSKSGERVGEADIMPWTYFSKMTDADLGAIYYFLQSLTPKPNSGDAYLTRIHTADQ